MKETILKCTCDEVLKKTVKKTLHGKDKVATTEEVVKNVLGK